jgi:hypothetical protein
MAVTSCCELNLPSLEGYQRSSQAKHASLLPIASETLLPTTFFDEAEYVFFGGGGQQQKQTIFSATQD